jgi:hypothetical protein
MHDEIELGSLKLADKSELVLTNLHIFQNEQRGILGERHTIIARSAISTVRLGWERSRWLAVLGTILLLASLVLIISSTFADSIGVLSRNQILDFSSSAISFIQYSFMVAGIGLFMLFWFDKRLEIQIMAPTGTIGGMPRSFEEAQTFCSLFVPKMREQFAIARQAEQRAASKPKATDPDWQF